MLEGEIGAERICARLRRIDDSRLFLLDRGFHGINEFPDNHRGRWGGF